MNSLLPLFLQIPPLAALPEDARRRLERSAEQRQYRRRQVIHFADQSGDFVYLLCTGRVKLSRVSEQGREVTLYLIEGPELFGESGLNSLHQTYELMAETLEDSTIAVFRRTDILPMLRETPDAAIEMMRLAGERRVQAETQLADLVFLEVPRRLAKLLLRLDEAHGDKTGRIGVPLRAKFTHQELANMIGSTRETTTLILNDFKRRGLLDFQGRRIILRDRGELESVLRRGQVK